MKMAIGIALVALALAGPARAATPEPAKPLFASDDIIHLVIRGPIDVLAKGGPDSRTMVSATINVAGTADSVPVQLALRGITRRRRDICQFPPLRVVFSQPPATSLFAGQHKLKLITHCRATESFQQYVLLEYGTYKLYNQLTPLSFRARLAKIEYQDTSGRPITSRVGFLLEEIDDVGRRNGLREAKLGSRIPVESLSRADAARVALFEYMVGNLDWALQAGPEGDNCCHNIPLVSAGGGGAPPIFPVPYDWDFSGVVDAPYAVPPDTVNVTSVRQRRYRGFCQHNADARTAIAQYRAMQAPLLATFATVPGMDERTARKANAYLGGFFADIATDANAETRLFKTCI